MWPDGYIIFQTFGHLQAIKIGQIAQNVCQNVLNILPKTENSSNIAKDFESFAKMVKFRQTWSHWLWMSLKPNWLRRKVSLIVSRKDQLRLTSEQRPQDLIENKLASNNWLDGREPWSSGYGRLLVFKRSWVQIPAPYTGRTFSHLFVVKLYCLFKKTKNKWKRGRGWPI